MTESRHRVPLWITCLPVVICLVLNTAGMALARMQWAAAVGGNGDTTRPNELAAAVPDEALVYALIQVLSAVMLVLAGWVSAQERELAVLTSGVVVMLAIFQWGGLLGRQGLDSAAVSTALALLIGVVVGVASALATWSAVRPPSQVAAPVVDLVGSGSGGLWTDHTRVARTLTVAPLLAVLPLTAMLLWALASVGHGLALLVALALAVMVALQLALRVRVLVDRSGVIAQGLGVFPLLRIPLASIAWAQPISDINPIGDFGGWGLRGGYDGTRALVTDAGAGVKINQTSGQAVVITVEHPTEAAAVINGLVWGRNAASDSDRQQP